MENNDRFNSVGEELNEDDREEINEDEFENNFENHENEENRKNNEKGNCNNKSMFKKKASGIILSSRLSSEPTVKRKGTQKY